MAFEVKSWKRPPNGLAEMPLATATGHLKWYCRYPAFAYEYYVALEK